MLVRVYNYNTLERLHQFEAHSDYIRSIVVHPTQPYILTSSGMLYQFVYYYYLKLLFYR
jgi:WD40 repeat protein